MLSRLISIYRPSRRLLSLRPSPAPSPSSRPLLFIPRFFSAAGSSNGDDGGPQSTSEAWNLTSENDDLGVFGDFKDEAEPSLSEEREIGAKPWSVGGDEKVEDVFALGEEETGVVEDEKVDLAALVKEEETLKAVLKGPNRAFGDLVAASGISDAMLDSLMALKNFDEIVGLPPLAEIEDMRYEKSLKNKTRAEMERLKQEEIAKSRVRTVDELGRAYGTGKRKCSIARVWIQPGDGNFVVNDKQFDVYFPMLDQRAALLRPFSETKTLGLWDVKCTVKGGGMSGQVGAVRLGVSRALQNWEPGLRPPLREAGFLTRDSRVVERKKPGKAKARKSFQWVKR